MRILLALALSAVLAAPAAAQSQPDQRAARPRDENMLYMQGQRALNAGRWQVALESFTRLAALNGTRRDAALYWTAYTQNRLGQRAEALQTLSRLVESFPDSRYAGQARALEVEVRRDAGESVAPANGQDAAIRMIALQGLLRSDPDRAVPLLDELLRGAAAPRQKNRALFLLAQSRAPQAQQLLADAARGLKSAEIQDTALAYLSASRTAASRQVMVEIYSETRDVNIRRQVLRALLRADDAETLVALARNEADTMRRREIVQALSQLRNNRTALDYLEELAR